MRRTKTRTKRAAEPEKRVLRPRLEFKPEEGFSGNEVKKALLESIYEKERQERRKAAELEREQELEKAKAKKEKKLKKKKKKKESAPKSSSGAPPSTQDFIRFISLDYTNDDEDLPEDLRGLRNLPLETIPQRDHK